MPTTQTITVDVPPEIAAQLPQIGSSLADLLAVASERLPTALELRLRHAPTPLDLYRTILGFIAQNPSPQEIRAFTFPPDAQFRFMRLRDKADADELSPAEREELEHIEALLIVLKAMRLSDGPLTPRS